MKFSSPPDALVFGSTGKLGRELVSVFDEACEIAPRDRYDFRDAKSVAELIRKSDAKVVINAVALNGMEACEDRPQDAMDINCHTPRAIADVCEETGKIFIHYSSDYAVYPSTAWEECDDFQLADSANYTFSAFRDVYSRSKFRGEMEIARSRARFLVLRLSSIYSTDALNGPLDCVKQYREGRGTPDNPIQVLKQFTAPTSVRTIALKTQEIVRRTENVKWAEHKLGLTFNMVCNEPCWKRTFAWNALWAFTANPKLQEVVIREGTLEIPRPVFSALSPIRLQYRFGVRMPTVIEDLSNAAARWQKLQESKSNLTPQTTLH